MQQSKYKVEPLTEEEMAKADKMYLNGAKTMEGIYKSRWALRRKRRVLAVSGPGTEEKTPLTVAGPGKRRRRRKTRPGPKLGRQNMLHDRRL